MELEDIKGAIAEAFEARNSAESAGNTETAQRADNALAALETRMEAIETANARAETVVTEEVAETRSDEDQALEQRAVMLNWMRSHSPDFQQRADTYDAQVAPTAAVTIDNVLQGDIIEKAGNTGAIWQNSKHVNIAGSQYQTIREASRFEVAAAGEKDFDRALTDVADLELFSVSTEHVYAKPRITLDILEDSAYDLEGYTVRSVAKEMGRHIAQRLVSGTGAIKGIVGAVGTASDDPSVIEQVDAAGATLAFSDLGAVEASLRSDYLDGAKWYMSRSFYNRVRGLEDTGNLIQETPFAQGRGMFRSLLGYEIVLDDYLSDVGAGNVTAFFGNMMDANTIVEKRGMTLLKDPYSADNAIIFKFTRRVGAGLEDGQALRALRFGV